MQKNIVETVMGGVVLLVALGFLFFFYRTTDIHPATGYQIGAHFTQIDGLQVGSPVRVSGVKVGQVTDFSLDPKTYQAVVHMNIDNGVKLPKDTAAVVASAGLLDGKFMTLQPGGAEDFLKAGDEIQYTQSSPSLEQMLGQFIFSATKNSKGGDSDAADTSAPAGAETPAAPASAPAEHP